MGQIEELTPEQRGAIDALVSAFGVKHGRLSLDLKIKDGDWESVSIDTPRTVLRKCVDRRRIHD